MTERVKLTEQFDRNNAKFMEEAGITTGDSGDSPAALVKDTFGNRDHPFLVWLRSEVERPLAHTHEEVVIQAVRRSVYDDIIRLLEEGTDV